MSKNAADDLQRLVDASKRWSELAQSEKERANEEMFVNELDLLKQCEKQALMRSAHELVEQGCVAETNEVQKRLSESADRLLQLERAAEEALRDAVGVQRCVKRLRRQDAEDERRDEEQRRDEDQRREQAVRKRSCWLGIGATAAVVLGLAGVAHTAPSNAVAVVHDWIQHLSGQP